MLLCGRLFQRDADTATTGGNIMFDMRRIRHLNTKLVQKTIRSPVGMLTLIASDDELLGVIFEKSMVQDQHSFRDIVNEPGHPLLTQAENQLNEYFSGIRNHFEISLGLYGTSFQRRVWDKLLTIPYGRTCSYGDIAAQVGDTRKARPVGGAVGRNPIGIIVPCHRVIGKKGDLTGFGGGLEAKTYLLNLEAQKG
jgi:methylated-DNA-[protein]-cysteine S-methyltransferase